ncbi:glycoside hydrolase family 15 protein [Mycobacterium heidelbergense]|uniref:Glycoside hydrolase n=1 Tax=Mycobacterium heidelbergense TaxID=53376 RepID=A0A1X0D4S6_MYCHE|nr:glycoside hydrolase family 15 protein [Mycobacterium heidelbergense]MCV7050429.1 glycoside hydrolase family 15 protein [Mycobacterium heidelbergense]ORA67365.1 glycoside hydrolase [Mycobacterium heidelbergense]BBZ52777.1 glycoside hydrolase [Mycobacterium heidelbergense]
MTEQTIDIEAAFPPRVLREYALLADGERGALIGPQGEVTWMCAPRWDSDAVFSSLIGGGGVYAVTPTDVRHVWGGYYEPGTLIWRNRWTTRGGIVECREALAFPGDPDRVVLLRRLMGRRGTARLRVLLQPSAAFGRHGPGQPSLDDAVWSGRSGRLRWRWSGGRDARPVHSAHGRGEPLMCEITLDEGQHHDLVLELSERALPDRPPDPDIAWDATEAAWRRSVPELNCTIAPRDGRHAYAVLRGLTSSGGGMVAAATMSLPERAHTNQNYDYRYAWIRDQAYAGVAAAAVGATELLDRAIEFVGARLLEDGPHLKPAYTVTGGCVPAEETLDLPGYPGGTDKVGNRVNQQFQLDVFGEALQLLARGGSADRLDAEGWRAAQAAVAAIEKRWRDPDAGIWEIDEQHWTQSRLACVAGLRAIAKVAGAGTEVASCASLADAILADTAASSLHPRGGYWQRSPRLAGVDASLLLPPVRGAVPADDPRTRATLDAVRRELAHDGFVYRFRHDGRDLGDAEGAFLLCGFMMALAEHQLGHHHCAMRWFERNRAACGPPGLFCEEYDVRQRQLRGNLPQAFAHALLLECTATLADDAVHHD